MKRDKSFEWDFVQGNGTFPCMDHFDIPSNRGKPRGDFIRVPHASAQKKELGPGRRQCNRQFVVKAALPVGNHLVLVNHEDPRTFS